MLAYEAMMEAVTATAMVIMLLLVCTFGCCGFRYVAGHPVLPLCMDIEALRHDGAMDGMGHLVARPSLALDHILSRGI